MATEQQVSAAPARPAEEERSLNWEEAFSEQPQGQDAGGAPPKARAAEPPRQKAASAAPAGQKPLDLDFILDIPLEVSVEVGRTKMLINDLLQLSQGSVIELSKLVGEPFEVLVNNKLVARGEVVVVNERFGVRLTDIISPMERIEQLR
jgi:flagellar motor switch protein FliN/FliY